MRPSGSSISHSKRAALSCLEGNKKRLLLLDEDEAREESVEDFTNELPGLCTTKSPCFQNEET